MIQAVLFDLDGTLLPMDQDVFVSGYFQFLCQKMIPYGYEPKKLSEEIWRGVSAMVKNDGSCRNEEAFWNYFVGVYGETALAHKPIFEEFYAKEFQKAKQFCGFTPESAGTVRLVRQMGFQAVLATNPLFPSVATESRIRWAGLDPKDFDLYTTYENSRTCKPNPDYYREIFQKLTLRAEECVMVGNDTEEDMIAETLGMKVFLLTDCLINKNHADLNRWPHGSFSELRQYLDSLRA